jgi:cyclic pyranopterin phosphate synthase
MKIQPEVDSHKLIYHPDRVNEWKENKDCYPIYVEVGPTNRCNHKCEFCALDWLEKGGSDIDKNIMMHAIRDMAEHDVKSIMFAGEGEPLLHKNIGDFVEFAGQKNMDVSITTNGVLFDKKMAEKTMPYLSWIRFSIDAGDKESYAKIHGTRKEDFNKVLENIKSASEIRKEKGYNTSLGTQVLLTSEAVDSIEGLAKLVKNAGADNLQIKPYSQHPSSINKLVVDYGEYLELEDKLKEHNSEDFKVMFRKKTMQRLNQERDYSECYGTSFFALITCKGDVIPCNLFYNKPEFSYGNLNIESFSKIWEGEKRQEVIKKLKKGGVNECREGCRLDAINRYLARLENPHPHDNFI